MNSHIGGGTKVISRIHGGNYFGEGNEEGERVIDFAISNDLVVCNTIFKKSPEHLITYKSGNRASQIDFMLYRRCDRVEIQDCKVIPGDHVTAQHRLVTLDLAIMVTQKQIGKRQGLKRIKWFKLKYPEKKMEFKERVLNELEPQIIDVEDWWNRSSGVILRVAREVLGECTGKIIENKEPWWFNEEVQQKTQLKKEDKKKHEQISEKSDRVAYKQLFDVLTEAVRENPPWCVLYADDVILLAKSKRGSWNIGEKHGEPSQETKVWLADNETTDWTVGLKFVQFKKKSSFHSGIKRTPFAALFGSDAKIGLTTSSLPDENISRLEKEEDLLNLFEEQAAMVPGISEREEILAADADPVGTAAEKEDLNLFEIASITDDLQCL
ncbi:hypothetical protein Pmani_004170 [Petrolisthes manimaculis]|uniref:Uncharacterized protein n=1 Tax=Petrolisthes manimaculis TaxID=1843537 RepID=A0AAE1QFD6_9EUCA|nr:hypothetical protein Pmani_004170 [Petrolisthes manimaculis]